MRTDHKRAHRRALELIQAVEAMGPQVVDSGTHVAADGTPLVGVVAAVPEDVESVRGLFHREARVDALERALQGLLIERERLLQRLRAGDAADTGAEEASEPRVGPDLDGTAAAVYDDVLDHGPTGSTAVAERIDVAPQTVHYHVGNLQEDGMVAAEEDPDDGRRDLYEVVNSDDEEVSAEGPDLPRDPAEIPGADLVNESDRIEIEPEAIPSFEDFGADSEPDAECQNCGTPVSPEYARVFVPEGESGPRTCPNCDLIRERTGEVRPPRNRATADGGETA